jgi:hypothetical protein
MTMSTEVTVKLTDAEIVERARTMAAKVQHLGVLRRKKRDDSKNTQALIDAELDEIERLARVIGAQEELRKQGELFADQETAATVLAEVGKKACLCPPEAMVVGSVLVDCPVHGDDAPVPWVVNVSGVDAAVADDEEEHDGAEEDEDDDEQDDEDDEAEERIAEATSIAAGAIASVTAGSASSAAPTRTRTGRGPLARASGRRAPAPRARAKARR